MKRWDPIFGDKSPRFMIEDLREAFCLKCDRVITLRKDGTFKVHGKCKNSGLAP